MTSLASGPQEACERSLAEMESSHQQVMEQLQRHHERELQRLQQEKEWLLAEETAATASGEDHGQRLLPPLVNWETPVSKDVVGGARRGWKPWKSSVVQ